MKKSIWHEKTELPRFQELTRDIKTEAVVIGGGIAGILTAHFLKERGVPTVLLEKGRICGGVTGNTTAKITFQHGLCYERIANDFGIEGARMYLDANREAFRKFTGMCSVIDCDYEEKDSYVYSVYDRDKLENELRTLERIGYKAELCEELPLPIKTVGAVKFPAQAQFDPLKLLSSLAKGLNIYENTHVREVRGNLIITDHAKIKAKHIVVATHFPFINKHGLYFLKLYQHRSYVTALENAQNVNGIYVDESQTGLSFRNYKNLLFLGGGDHRTGKDGGNYTELRRFAKEHYPNAKEKYAWAAEDCMSLDGIPYIGRYSKNTPNLYVASGFNKWGMTGAMLSAMIISDMITNGKNEYEKLFDPSRSILKPQLFVNGFESVTGLLTISKKRCPHLGCALKWNRAEHTWDCSCHGSRFSEGGELLNNPANRDLKL